MPKPSISSTGYEQSAWLTFQGIASVEGDPSSPEQFTLASACLHTILAALLEQADDYFATTTREVDDEVDHFRGWHDDQELADTLTYQHLRALTERTHHALLEHGGDARSDYSIFKHLSGVIAQLAANEAILDS